MKTKLTYIANDGTPFDTEKECIEYEEKLTNKYIVCYKDKETTLIKMEFYSEPLAKRYIANCLHDCYEDNIVGDFKIVHCGKTVEFNSTELGEVVPTHLKINGEKLNEVFKLAVARDVKIPGYTLHGDYYLADEAISYTNWEVACKMKKPVILPNGKTAIAHTLSREELESIPREERKISENGHCWYWTSTPYGGDYAWYVNNFGDFDYGGVAGNYGGGGARLGFKNPFTN
jgi:hypothetical protein